MKRKFAFVAEGDVFMVWTFDSEETEGAPDEKIAMILAGMSSNPKVIEFMPDQDIGEGWTHDGIGFVRPRPQ
jgi:hypothetical protein